MKEHRIAGNRLCCALFILRISAFVSYNRPGEILPNCVEYCKKIEYGFCWNLMKFV